MDESSMKDAGAAAAPLTGLVVLDLSNEVSGSYAALLLADLGATVVKIEDTGRDRSEDDNGEELQGPRFDSRFIAFNRGKRSVCLDLSGEDGWDAVRELAAGADVLIDNLAPGSAETMGLTWPILSHINRRLILCRITPFGGTGRWRDKPACNLVLEAASGLMDITGEAGRPPVRFGVPAIGLQTAVTAVNAILAVVHQRRSTHVGAHLDVSMLDVAAGLLLYLGPMYLCLNKIPARLGTGHATIYPYNAFEAADGYLVVAPFTEDFWRNYCRAIVRPDLVDDPDYADASLRRTNRDTLARILDPIMRTRSVRDWLDLLVEVDVPAGPVNSVADALTMEQTVFRDMVAPLNVPGLGETHVISSPFRITWSDSGDTFLPSNSLRPPPELGECSWSEALRAVGLIAEPSAGAIQTRPSMRDERYMEPVDVLGPSPGARPLQGLRVIDLTRMATGPWCTQMLSDLGADVIKVEAPPIGDPIRRDSLYFISLNRGKRSLVADLKTGEGSAKLIELARDADVLIENYRPDVMQRLGLDYAALRAVNPSLIVCSISGFGQTGPGRLGISFDLINQSIAGFLSVTGEEGRPPVRIGPPVGDLGGGSFACAAILAALYRRDVAGSGCYIDMSLHEALIAQLGCVGQEYLLTGIDPRPMGSAHTNIAPHGVYATKDGEIALAAYTTPEWVRLAEAFGDTRLLDGAFATTRFRFANRQRLDQLLLEIVATRSTSEWAGALDGANVRWSQVNSVADALELPQVRDRALILTTEYSSVPNARVVASPFVIDGTRLSSARRTPQLGEFAEDGSWLPAEVPSEQSAVGAH